MKLAFQTSLVLSIKVGDFTSPHFGHSLDLFLEMKCHASKDFLPLNGHRFHWRTLIALRANEQCESFTIDTPNAPALLLRRRLRSYPGCRRYNNNLGWPSLRCRRKKCQGYQQQQYHHKTTDQPIM